MAVVAAVAVTRVWQARESLWLDELHTAWAAGSALGLVAPRAMAGNQSPLFFWLEWLAMRLPRTGEVAVRLPSLVSAVLMPVALFLLTKKWTGSSWIGLLPAWLYAVDPQAIYFGTEARPYAMIQLLAVAHVALFASTIQRPSAAKRGALIAGMALLFYLNYTAVLLLGAEWTYYAVRLWTRNRPGYRWTQLATDAAALAILSLGALPTVRLIADRRGNWESFVAQRPLWLGMLMVPWAWSAVVALLIVLGVRALRAGRRVEPVTSAPTTLALAFCWLTVPLIVTWAATESNVARLLHPRYLAGAAPAALVLIALAVSLVPWSRARIGIAMTFAIVAPLFGRFPTEVAEHQRLVAYREDDWRGAIRAFNQMPGHDRDPVLLRSLLIESDALGASPDSTLADYCLYPLTSLYKLDADRGRLIALRRTNAWRMNAADLERVKGAPGFWMFLNASGAQADFIAEQFTHIADFGAAGAAGAPRWTTTSRAAFGSVQVLRFDQEH